MLGPCVTFCSDSQLLSGMKKTKFLPGPSWSGPVTFLPRLWARWEQKPSLLFPSLYIPKHPAQGWTYRSCSLNLCSVNERMKKSKQGRLEPQFQWRLFLGWEVCMCRSARFPLTSLGTISTWCLRPAVPWGQTCLCRGHCARAHTCVCSCMSSVSFAISNLSWACSVIQAMCWMLERNQTLSQCLRSLNRSYIRK